MINRAAPATVSELLMARAEAVPDALAFEFWSAGNIVDRLTYAELHTAACASARRFAAAGSRHRPVMLMHPPGLDFIVDFFGCLYAGSTAVPSPPPTHARDKARISALIKAAQPAIAATSCKAAGPQTLQAWQADWPEITLLALDRDFDRGAQPHVVSPKDLAVIQFTSGSTAAPNGVALSHQAILCNLAQIHAAFDFRSAERQESVVLWLPHFHDMGLFARLECIFAACPGHLMSPTEFIKRPVRWLELLTKTRATVTGAPNFAFDLCAGDQSARTTARIDLSGLRIAFCGAEPIDPTVLDRFEAAFSAVGLSPGAITPCYGLAEATLMVASHVPGRRRRTLSVDAHALESGRVIESTGAMSRTISSCGPIVVGLETAIVDPHAHSPAQHDRVGEIWIRGANVTIGYIAERDEGESFGRLRGDERDSQCFLRTGDLGFFDEGELFVVGRIKNIIIVRGRNLHPHDLERTALGAHPSLHGARAAAVAIETPNGERPAILIEVPRSLENQLSLLKEAVDAIRVALSMHFDVDAARIVIARRGAISMTTSGKIAHGETGRRLRDGAIETLLAWPESAPRREQTEGQVATVILAIVSEVLGRSVHETHLGFKALGGDSLAAYRVAARLQEAYGDAFNENELLFDFPLREIASRLDERLVERVNLFSESESEEALILLGIAEVREPDLETRGVDTQDASMIAECAKVTL